RGREHRQQPGHPAGVPREDPRRPPHRAAGAEPPWRDGRVRARARGGHDLGGRRHPRRRGAAGRRARAPARGRQLPSADDGAARRARADDDRRRRSRHAAEPRHGRLDPTWREPPPLTAPRRHDGLATLEGEKVAMARSTSKKDLKARIKKLERKLRSSQAEAEKARAKSKKWKKRAKRDDAAVTDATAATAAPAPAETPR